MIVKNLKGENFKVEKCLGCEIANKKLPVVGGLIYESKNFAIAQDFELPINGFLIIFSKRHVEEYTELTDDERLELASLINSTLTGLKKFKVAKEYNIILEEKQNYHFHVWLMPRHTWMIEKFGKVLKNIQSIFDYSLNNLRTTENFEQIEKTCEQIKLYLSNK